MPRRMSLKVNSRVEHLDEIAEFVQAAAHTRGLEDQQTDDVRLAVDEACSNIIEHAYEGRTDGTIEISCARRGDEFIVTIRDYGKPFDPQRIARPDTHVPLAKRNVGGLGLLFIYKSMDRVEWRFSAKHGNLLTMAKRIR